MCLKRWMCAFAGLFLGRHGGGPCRYRSAPLSLMGIALGVLEEWPNLEGLTTAEESQNICQSEYGTSQCYSSLTLMVFSRVRDSGTYISVRPGPDPKNTTLFLLFRNTPSVRFEYSPLLSFPLFLVFRVPFHSPPPTLLASPTATRSIAFA